VTGGSTPTQPAGHAVHYNWYMVVKALKSHTNHEVKTLVS
jgi:hypothetical protein